LNQSWLRIPAELRELPQWVIAAPDKTPLSIKADGTIYACSSTVPEEWLSFEQAATVAWSKGFGIGFMLSANDPYCCVDFDVIDAESQARKGQVIDPSKWTHPDMFHWIWGIAEKWASYVETSVNGKGLHIWVKAKLEKGWKRANLEVYTQWRYIICTGNAVLNHPIQERQQTIEDFVKHYLRPKNEKETIDLVDVEETETDDVLWARARDADNYENFVKLCSGKWSDMGYPSQSEADLALMSMFTFYSKSNAQCKRMFRQTVLGQREKAQKNDRYLNLTLKIIRTRQANEDTTDFSALIKGAELRAKLGLEKEEDQSYPNIDLSLLIAKATAKRYDQFIPSAPEPVPAGVAAAAAVPIPAAVKAVGAEGLPWPPGFAGDLARFIYESAPRQVKEVAIVGALGFLAGICGKGWYIPGSGLNMYIILVAQSAIGKEAMHSGISTILKNVAPYSPSIYNFVSFDDFASGQALTKACVGTTCFVNVCGEWGHKLRRIGNDNDTAMQSLRRVMTDLYQKSGPQAIVGGIRYSAQENNIEAVSGVAYSMIGETTPKTFYGALTESMMEDGFLSRFIIVEYSGDRPPLNHMQAKNLLSASSQYIASMTTYAMQRMSNIGEAGPMMVNPSQEALEIFHTFEKECDNNINGTAEEAKRQMWNRAALKVMRISALLAVADNYMHPLITKEHVEWALAVIRKDIASMARKLAEGDIGVNDTSREQKVLSIIVDFLRNGAASSYNVPKGMREAMCFPGQFILLRCCRLPAFTAHKAGSTGAVREVLRSLVDSGYIEELHKDKAVTQFNFHGKTYRVLQLPENL
jgi:hypothetical protein